MRLEIFLGVITALGSAACQAGTSDAQTGGGGSSFASTGTGAGGEAPSCAKYEHTEVHHPVNLYIMFDKSSSMAGSKWTSAVAGLSAYVDSPGTDSIQAALRFFPRPPDAIPVCDQSAYKTPTVDYGALPGNAAAIKLALTSETPSGFNTPMYPALGGALLESIDKAANSPGQVSAVLLVTDGKPEGPAAMCNSVDPTSPQVIADLAANGLAKGVATYVVGLPGVDQASANLIAAAGGTGSAVLVGPTNVAVEFQKALAKISGSAVPCTYDIPAEVISGEIALSKVNVLATPSVGMPTQLVYDPTCANAGWRYDAEVPPTQIELCPAACTMLKADNGGSIKVVLGCSAILN